MPFIRTLCGLRIPLRERITFLFDTPLRKEKKFSWHSRCPCQFSWGWESQGLCPGFFSQLLFCYRALKWADSLRGSLLLFSQHRQGWYCDGAIVMERILQQLLAGRARKGLPSRTRGFSLFLASSPPTALLPSPAHPASVQSASHGSLLRQLCSHREPSHLRPCAVKKHVLRLWPGPAAPTGRPLSASPRALFGLRCDVLLTPVSFALHPLCGEPVVNLQSKHFFGLFSDEDRMGFKMTFPELPAKKKFFVLF